jgi:hypothetical protein
MISVEVASALARFFEDTKGCPHDELDRLIAGAGLQEADPRREDRIAGKMKRVRAVLGYAAENDAAAGDKLVTGLIGALRAAGSFRPGDLNFTSPATVTALQEALDAQGYWLAEDGLLRAKTMDGLEGVAMTEALRAYIRRARTAGDDAALKVGTAKDLAEATARHVLVERVGSYPPHGNFQVMMYQAYKELGLEPPTTDHMNAVSGDEWHAVERAIFLLGCAVNRFRNAQGTGHGRPHASLATDEQGRLAAEASALVSEILLDALT